MLQTFQVKMFFSLLFSIQNFCSIFIIESVYKSYQMVVVRKTLKVFLRRKLLNIWISLKQYFPLMLVDPFTADLLGHIFIIFIIIAAVVKVSIFLGVVAALVYIHRRRSNINEDQGTRTSTFPFLLFIIFWCGWCLFLFQFMKITYVIVRKIWFFFF